MKHPAPNLLPKFRPHEVSALFTTFLKDESIGGKLILLMAALSLIVVNSPLLGAYDRFWHYNLSIGIGEFAISMDLRHWVNEGLMAFFFLVVGLEIKRELVKGELRDIKRAILPIGAAVGGMVVPAVLYLAFNFNTDYMKGWGIPIATDIAFAVAVLTVLGNRVPVALKIFLLTLAIADDIGAIIVIALFYAEIVNYAYLAASAAIVLAVWLLRRRLVDMLWLVVLAGTVLWLTTHASGIHASIVGAAMGLLAPVATGKRSESVAERVEHFFLPISTFIVLPVFAFANAGFKLSGEAFSGNSPVFWGILAGLVAGKAIGVTLASLLMTRLGIAALPEGVTLRHILGVGLLAGIGFTVSIFITELAFNGNSQLVTTAKLSIFIASALSAIAGSLVLLSARRQA